MKKKKIRVPPNWEDRPDAFARFERLTQGLMAVSKKEVNKEIAKEQRKKGQRKGPKAA